MRQREEVQEMLRRVNRWFFIRLAAAATSGFLLACSFPLPPVLAGLEESHAAWLGLIPLLLALLMERPAFGALLGFVAGVIFHLIGLSWLLALRVTWGNVPLTVLSWIGLSLACSLYLAAFGYVFACASQRLFARGSGGKVLLLVLAGIFWVGQEYARAVWFTWFPWNLLGASQYRNPVLLQPARIAGVYGISFVIVLFNASLALTIRRVWQEVREHQRRRRIHVELMVGLLTVALVWSFGMRTMLRTAREADGSNKLRVAVVQPAIPQVQKWTDEHELEILDVLQRQTELALLSRPDLVVWPETATPGFLRIEPESRALARVVTDAGVALLAGTMDADMGEPRSYYNAALLIEPEYGIRPPYYKRHLVPFGEYLPFTGWFPALERFAPLGFSCAAGNPDQVLMELPGKGGERIASSILICFEDVFPYLARRDVRRGARILMNLTNDGWFDGTSAARQHLALAVLRAVETQTPMVRAANTGVSAFIDANGRFVEVPGERAEGSRGWGVREVVIPSVERVLPIYTRFGDWILALPCLLLLLVFGGWFVVRGLGVR